MNEAQRLMVEARNAERRALCAEYAQNEKRRGEIVARLAELSGEANKEAAASRICGEFRARAEQAMMVAPGPVVMPRGVVEDAA